MSNLALKETGSDDIEEINDTHIAEANMTFIKGGYKIEVGRFENNMSFNDVNTRQERLSLFFNVSGSLDNQRKWVMAAEIHGFENRNFISDNDEVTANLYLELSQKI